MKTAITGGIGSGKSYVCDMLRKRGIEIYDCDSAAKRLMRESPEIQRRLTELIGTGTYIAGKLNKRLVSEFLLRSEENKRAVNAIVHPAVAADFVQSGLQWMECAILYESGFDRLVDRVIAVTAPDETRVQRIVKRDNISAEKAREWIGAQMPQDEIARRADIVINNDGTVDIADFLENVDKFDNIENIDNYQ